jgi:chromosomal replication initiation ATPase DnaA
MTCCSYIGINEATSPDTIKRVLNDTGEVYRPKRKRIPLAELVKRVSETLKVDQGDLCSGDRKNQVSKARSVISYVAVREMGYSGVEVGRIQFERARGDQGH